jgi:hypothetical protein
MFVTSIACTIVNGDLGKLLDASCLVPFLLEHLGKTDNNTPAKFNTSRSMVELNALVTVQCTMELAYLSRIFQIVVPVALKVIGLIGLLALSPAAMVAQSQEPVLLPHQVPGTPILPFVALICLCVATRSRPKTVAHHLVLKIVSAVIGLFGLIA